MNSSLAAVSCSVSHVGGRPIAPSFELAAAAGAWRAGSCGVGEVIKGACVGPKEKSGGGAGRALGVLLPLAFAEAAEAVAAAAQRSLCRSAISDRRLAGPAGEEAAAAGGWPS